MWAVVYDIVTLRFKVGDNLVFKIEASMVATDMNLHGGIFSNKRRRPLLLRRSLLGFLLPVGEALEVAAHCVVSTGEYFLLNR